MNGLQLVAWESKPINEQGINPGYGMVEIKHRNRVKVVYSPPLWDAVRASRKSKRHKRIIKKAVGGS